MEYLRLQLRPTMPMLAESLAQVGWQCDRMISDPTQSYRGVRLYHRQQSLHKDVLYLLRPTETAFPVDTYSYLSAGEIPGQANHLICPEYPDEVILDQLLEVFSQFQNWENAIDSLLYRNASLQELCELGSTLLENPVCIHDDWFVMMAITPDFAEMMEPEYWVSSAKGFVPRAIVEDFQDDHDYLETYVHHEAKVWHVPEKHQKTLYVNLWNGPIYKGRLLVARKNRRFLQRDFLLAEALAQRAVMLLKHKQLGYENVQQNMDEIVFALLEGRQIGTKDLRYLADILHWQNTDRFACVRIKPQQNATSMLEHTLHSDLFHCFPESYVLLDRQAQCVVINLTHRSTTLEEIPHLLSPLCRDYCLYAGISSPVNGIRELNIAYLQAGEALEQVFRLRSDKWIMNFSSSCIDYIVKNTPPPLTSAHLVAPELTALIEYDREKGTQYFETFREYLLQERDIPRTSEKLIIHRTTLLYRLKKIQSLIHVNLEDPWQRLCLMLSFWILDHSNNP